MTNVKNVWSNNKALYLYAIKKKKNYKKKPTTIRRICYCIFQYLVCSNNDFNVGTFIYLFMLIKIIKTLRAMLYVAECL